jgi:hypothetical protein
MTEPVLISQYMCGKSEAGLGGMRTGFNYRDPGPFGKQGDVGICWHGQRVKRLTAKFEPKARRQDM